MWCGRDLWNGNARDRRESLRTARLADVRVAGDRQEDERLLDREAPLVDEEARALLDRNAPGFDEEPPALLDGAVERLHEIGAGGAVDDPAVGELGDGPRPLF